MQHLMNQAEHVKQALRVERRYYGVICRYDDGSFMVPGARFTSFLRQNTLDELTHHTSLVLLDVCHRLETDTC